MPSIPAPRPVPALELTRCAACGHPGGTRAPEPELAAQYVSRPPLLVCAGPLSADDGPVACLRRLARSGSHR